MVEIQKELKRLQELGLNPVSIIERLVKAGFSKEEIIKAIDGGKKIVKWKPNYLGIIYIVLAICTYIFIQPTYGAFSFSFDSGGDMFRLSEWVLKPFFSIMFFVVGVFLLTNKGYWGKSIKRTLIVFSLIFIVVTISGISYSGLALSLISIAVVLFTKNYPVEKKEDLDEVFRIVEEGMPREDILSRLGVRKWNGSFVSVFYIFSGVLFFNSPIYLSRAVPVSEMSALNYYLFLSLIFLTYASLIVGVAEYWNSRKFKVMTYVFAILTAGHFIACFIHENFQNSIFPCIIIFIAAGITIANNINSDKRIE